jgi:hypothetical protein
MAVVVGVVAVVAAAVAWRKRDQLMERAKRMKR